MTQVRFRAEVVIVLGLCLDAESQQDAEERARRMACSRQRIRPQDIRNMVVMPMTVCDQLTHDNVCVWQETQALALGDFGQRQRWNSGSLPEPELLLLARNELFMPFALCERRTRKGPAAIAHPTDTSGTWLCASSAVNGTIPITWSTRPDPLLTDAQWKALQRLLTASEEVRRHRWMAMSPPTSVRIEIREHRGECMMCHNVVSELGALVEIDWAGRPLSREYAL